MAGATALYVLLLSLQNLVYFIRNTAIRNPSTRALVKAANGVVRITIKPRHPFKVRAGQYLHLWMPGVDFWSLFQTHPFMITWWDEDQHGRACSILLLAQPRRGFTSKLLRPQIARKPLLAWIDGPHGQPAEYSDFSHTLLIACGIGIAAQLPVVKEMLKTVTRQKSRTRSIHLLWEIESDGIIPVHFDQKSGC
jgi:NAD(P)H-flavin reductase